ncbi:biotin transporter BioY [Zavarzinia compransoris]|uniref:Biotin transporter n=1 Tax=Zavarzinia compransoris TaxID=1264899 RepID=A0A317E618_9PROT|nr:biotin transporter BioY [Zavarzinia compransoris]PWR22062.1 biotin transporter BioY [Zavarzinia compransoris]TDP47196.1 biotin transport system substrate-specific component [Zavarzinia compransoris]
MIASQPLSPTLIAGEGSLIRKALIVVAGSLALWASAKVQVPFLPVPITMQTLVVLGFAMAAGRNLALATVGLYLLEGALGLPVFAGTPEKGIGLAYMMGPTGGYLLGMVLAAGILGSLGERGWDRRALTTAAAMVLGNLAIYACGLAWLGTYLGYGEALVQAGLLPFVPGDLFKIALAAVMLPGAWKLLAALRG